MATTDRILIAGFCAVCITIGASAYFVTSKLSRVGYYAAGAISSDLIQYDQEKVRAAAVEAAQKRSYEADPLPFLIPPAPARK